jgi:hypothetical protein
MRRVDLDNLDVGQREELGYLLLEEARRLRRTLREDAAWGAWQAAPLAGTGWATSDLADVGRVRIAVRRLMTLDHWEPHQIREAMMAVALHVCPERGIAHLAVEAGIEDGTRILGNDRAVA